MKVVAVDSAILAVPTPKPMALEFLEHRLVVAHVHTDEGLSGTPGCSRARSLFVDVPRPDPADGLVRIPDRPGHGMVLAPGAERKCRLR